MQGLIKGRKLDDIDGRLYVTRVRPMCFRNFRQPRGFRRFEKELLMPTRRELLALTSGAAVTAAAGLPVPAQATVRTDGWTATWAAAPTTIPPTPPTVLARQTVRQIVHTSLGGDEIRIRVTNEFGAGPLRLGAVRVALRAGEGASTAIVPGTDRRVTFGNQASVTIPAGSPLVSDPVRLRVNPGADLAVSLF